MCIYRARYRCHYKDASINSSCALYRQRNCRLYMHIYNTDNASTCVLWSVCVMYVCVCCVYVCICVSLCVCVCRKNQSNVLRQRESFTFFIYHHQSLIVVHQIEQFISIYICMHIIYVYSISYTNNNIIHI